MNAVPSTFVETTEDQQPVTSQKAGIRTVRRAGEQSDDASVETAKILKRLQEDNAARQESDDAANEAAYSVDPKANEECLKAIAKIFEIKTNEFKLSEELADLSLVKTYIDPDTELETLIVKTSDNVYLVSNASIEAQNEMVSPKAAFEMAILARNNPQFVTQDITLTGNLRDRYMLQLAADTVGIKLANRVEEKDIPADMKDLFAQVKADWDAFVTSKESPSAAAKVAPAASKERADPTIGDDPIDLGADRPEPTMTDDPVASTKMTEPPTFKEALDTTSDKVVSNIRNLRDQMDGRTPAVLELAPEAVVDPPVSLEEPTTTEVAATVADLTHEEIAIEAHRLSELPGRGVDVNDENWFAAEGNLKLMREHGITQDQVDAKARAIWEGFGAVDDLGQSAFKHNQAAVQVLVSKAIEAKTGQPSPVVGADGIPVLYDVVGNDELAALQDNKADVTTAPTVVTNDAPALQKRGDAPTEPNLG